MKKLVVISSVFLALALGCKEDEYINPFNFDDVPVAFDTTGKVKSELESDFYYYDIEIGTGPEVTHMDFVDCFFTVRAKHSDRVIASSYVNSNPYAAGINLANSISLYSFSGLQNTDFVGMRLGIKGMKVGGKRTIIVPSRYGLGLQSEYVLDFWLGGIRY